MPLFQNFFSSLLESFLYVYEFASRNTNFWIESISFWGKLKDDIEILTFTFPLLEICCCLSEKYIFLTSFPTLFNSRQRSFCHCLQYSWPSLDSQNKELKMIYHFDYLPAGLFNRVQVCMNELDCVV